MDPAVVRDDMVDSLEHESKGCVRSERLSVAMRTVPRESFVPADRGAYADRPFERLGTRVLAPSTAARLLEALDVREGDTVLVVGAGVGYTAAVCAEIAGARNVHAIDIARRLVVEARENLATAGYGGVLVDRRDGADGLPEYATYDRILLESAAVDPPRALLDQLADGGRLVMPHGVGEQTLVAVEHSSTSPRSHAPGDAVERRSTSPDSRARQDAVEHSSTSNRPEADDAGRASSSEPSVADAPEDAEIVERLGSVAFRPMLVEGEQAETVERNRTRREDREFARQHARSRAGWEQEWIDWDDY